MEAPPIPQVLKDIWGTRADEPNCLQTAWAQFDDDEYEELIKRINEFFGDELEKTGKYVKQFKEEIKKEVLHSPLSESALDYILCVGTIHV